MWLKYFAVVFPPYGPISEVHLHFAEKHTSLTWFRWQNHRIKECQGVEGTSEDHLVQSPCWSRNTWIRSHRNISRKVLNVSREGDPKTSLGSLFQCSINLTIKKFLLILCGISCVPACTHCPLSYHWMSLRWACLHPPETHPLHIYKHYWGHPQSPLLWTKETQFPQPFHIREMLHSLNHLCGSALDSLKQFPVPLELRGPELDAVCQGRVEGEDNLSWHTNHTPSDITQDAIGLLDYKGSTMLALGHPAVHQDS